MPPAPGCKPLAEAVAALASERDVERARLAAMTPEARWTVGFETLTDLNRRIVASSADLSRCQRDSGSRLDIQVVVIDAMRTPTRSLGTTRSATVWSRQSAGTPPSALASGPVVGGMASVPAVPVGIGAGSVGLTVEVVEDSPAMGVEFRSGWRSDFPWTGPEEPVVPVEVVIGRVITIDQAALDALIADVDVPTTSAPIGVTGASLVVAVGSVRAVLDPPPVRLLASGTADVHGGPLGRGSATFAAEVPVTVGLVASPDPETVFEVQHLGGTSLEIGGPLEAFLAPAHELLVQLLADQTASALGRALDLALPGLLAHAFGLDVLPTGSTASVRSLDVSAAGLSLGPTLGAFGHTLSRFIGEVGVP
jgi:hypothetical protein